MIVTTLPSLLAVCAVVVSVVVGRRVAIRIDPAIADAVYPAVIECVGAGILCARAAFIATWWHSYRSDPLSMLRLTDGGFVAWAGVLGAVAIGVVHVARAPQLRTPLLAAFLSGPASFALAIGLLRAFGPAPLTVPNVAVTSLGGESTHLVAYLGRPMVLSVWATWCPPCRREMPLLLRAKLRHPDIAFALVNQGEAAWEVADYGRSLDAPEGTFLLDSGSAVSSSLGVRALPATFFFDAEGNLVSTHVGELSDAVLRQRLAVISIDKS